MIVQLEIKDKRDFDFLESLKTKSAEELDKLTERKDLVLNTPDPHMCIVCQRALTGKILSEGKINKNENYTQETKITLDAFVLTPEQLNELDDFYSAEFMDEDEFYDDEDGLDADIESDEEEEK